MINKNIVSSQTANSRNKIVDEILQNELKEDLGFEIKVSCIDENGAIVIYVDYPKTVKDDYLLDVWEYTEAELAGADILVIKQPGGSMTTSLCFLLGGFLAIIGAVVWYVINLKREFKYENKECDI